MHLACRFASNFLRKKASYSPVHSGPSPQGVLICPVGRCLEQRWGGWVLHSNDPADNWDFRMVHLLKIKCGGEGDNKDGSVSPFVPVEVSL